MRMDAGNAVVADDACVGAPERGPASAEKREPNPVALLLAWSLCRMRKRA